VEELVDLGNLIDGNGDGTFCLKAISNLRGSSDKNWGYFLRAVGCNLKALAEGQGLAAGMSGRGCHSHSYEESLHKGLFEE
jgi:hypothetical protein